MNVIYTCKRCHSKIAAPDLLCNCYVEVYGSKVYIPPAIHFTIAKNETIQEYLARYNAVDKLIEEEWRRAIREIKHTREEWDKKGKAGRPKEREDQEQEQEDQLTWG